MRRCVRLLSVNRVFLCTVIQKHLLFWVVSCGRMTLALCLILLVDVWELRKARLYDEILSFPQSQCQNSSGELGDVGDGGRLRCLYGKVDTTISCMCTCSVGSSQCSGCVVYGSGAMAAIPVLLLLIK